jgi:hypothetical protein
MSSPAYSISDSGIASAPTRTESSARERILIAAGFAVGAVLGMGGNFLPVGPAQNVAYGISALGLILASALFAARFARQGRDTVAVGFALLALAEGVVVSAGTPGDPGAEATFAGATALYVPALLLASLPAALPAWTRVVGALAAVPFGAHALLWWLGTAPPSSGPFAGIGYMLLTIAVVGWIITVLRAVPSDR